MNTKAQLGSVKAIIFAVLIAGVLIGAGFLVLGEFRDQFDDNLVTIANETTASINTTGYTVAGASDPGANTFVITQARNVSGAVINPANYTISSTGVVTNRTATIWSNVHLTYTYLAGDDSYQGIQSTLDASQNIPQLLSLVVLIALIVVVLALVFTIPGARGGA